MLYFQGNRIRVVQPLLSILENFTEPEIERVIGIIEVNNYELLNSTGVCGVRGLFPFTSLMSHSCVPNSRVAIKRTKPYGT